MRSEVIAIADDGSNDWVELEKGQAGGEGRFQTPPARQEDCFHPDRGCRCTRGPGRFLMASIASGRDLADGASGPALPSRGFEDLVKLPARGQLFWGATDPFVGLSIAERFAH
jgi:hypothetical protein